MQSTAHSGGLTPVAQGSPQRNGATGIGPVVLPIANSIFGTLSDEQLIERAKELARDGKLMTAPNGPVEASDNARRILALFENGLMLCAQGQQNSPDIFNARALGKRKGISVENPRPVSMEALADIYQHTRRTHTTAAPTHEAQDRVKKLITEAAALGASDLHIKKSKTFSRIHIRINGALQHFQDVPPEVGEALLGSLFASTDTADTNTGWQTFRAARLTQSDSKLLPIEIDQARVQYLPLAADGGKCVLRLQPSGRDQSTDVDSLGYTPQQQEDFRLMRRQSVGFNAISGPTGSGKTTTLQCSLNAEVREKRDEISVYTIEDPPELTINGASQVPVMSTKGADDREERYAQAMRAVLRADPDVIMIGEIRDREAANLTFAAVLSGHQVWTTIHANTALGILDRLRDIGVDEWKLRDSALMTGLVAQRLVRVLCPHCARSLSAAVKDGEIKLELAELAGKLCGVPHAELKYRGPLTGCGAIGCRRGFIRRTVCAETILPDNQMLDLYFGNAKTEATRYWLRDLKGRSMIQHGMDLMRQGITDLTELEEKVALLSSIAWTVA